MVLGQSLMGKKNEILLRNGSVLKQSFIRKIEELNIAGVYIDDDISKDIELKTVISDELRIQTVKGVKEFFVSLEVGKTVQQEEKKLTLTLIEDIVDEILSSRNTMINIVDLKVFDDYTYYHSVNVAVLSIVLGLALGLNRDDLLKLGIGALLHDVGKVFINKNILNKKEKLTDEEFITIKKHTYLGYVYLKDNYNVSALSYVGALQHHEKYDGTGYPHGKKGFEISKFGRIIAIADVYDALISDRPYRKAMLPSEAMEYLMANGGCHFDPEFVRMFVRKVAPYPIGTGVKLSNGNIGLVTQNYEGLGTRPSIKIIKQDDKYIEPFILHLNEAKHSNITIISTVIIS